MNKKRILFGLGIVPPVIMATAFLLNIQFTIPTLNNLWWLACCASPTILLVACWITRTPKNRATRILAKLLLAPISAVGGVLFLYACLVILASLTNGGIDRELISELKVDHHYYASYHWPDADFCDIVVTKEYRAFIVMYCKKVTEFPDESDVKFVWKDNAWYVVSNSVTSVKLE